MSDNIFNCMAASRENIFVYLDAYKGGIEVAIKIGTLAISALTLLGALIGGLRSLGSLAADRRSKRLAEFIALFSDEHEIKRLSGVNGLSRYARKLFEELFFICSVEKNDVIRELIYDALRKQAPRRKARCIQINGFAVNYLLRYGNQKELLDGVTLDEKMTGTLANGQAERRIRFELDREAAPDRFARGDSIGGHLLLSSHMLSFALRRSFCQKLSGALIVRSDMYRSEWIKNSLEDCVLVKDIARRSRVFLTSFRRCHLKDSNYLDSRFFGTRFDQCVVRGLTFREAKFSRAVFSKSVFRNTGFSKAVFSKCVYENKTVILASSWNGCVFEKCRLERTHVIASEIKGTNFYDTRFTDVKFRGSGFIAEFRRCAFENVDWGDSALKSIKFTDCVFKKNRFAGVEPTYLTFSACRFADTELDLPRSESIVFEGGANDRLVIRRRKQ